ncbi:MAG: hypothetical protein Ct9H300mP1_05880 [Planctomycetaceae bacterium]|nr:MAG: hypothetical protein Ct9H300mP1_05880 [Planctomycetaceae bacterium]
MRSDDGGVHWTWPQTLIDTAIDDPDAGVVETPKGSLLVTTFTSLAFEQPSYFAGSGKQRIARGKAAPRSRARSHEEKDAREWIIRSTDGGQTGHPPPAVESTAPRGPSHSPTDDCSTRARNSTTTKTASEPPFPPTTAHLEVAGTIPTRPGDDHHQYHELHAVEAAPGRLIAHIRNHNPKSAGRRCRASPDGGGPGPLPTRWGSGDCPPPAEAGRRPTLMSYGHRRKPSATRCGSATTPADLVGTQGALGGWPRRDLGYPSRPKLATATWSPPGTRR